MADDASQLSPELRAALDQELDTGERLLWSGQPDAARVFRSQLWPMFLLCAVVGAIFVGLVFSMWQGWLEIVYGSQARSEWMPTAAFLLFVLLVLTVVIVVAARKPWRERARARRTVLAVTSTRLITLELSRRGDATVSSLEPGHPLDLVRVPYADGTGTILIHPSRGPSNRPRCMFVGIRNPREVDRIIRATFDPPPPAR